MLKLMKFFGKSLSDESFWEKFDLTNSEIKEVQNEFNGKGLINSSIVRFISLVLIGLQIYMFGTTSFFIILPISILFFIISIITNTRILYVITEWDYRLTLIIISYLLISLIFELSYWIFLLGISITTILENNYYLIIIKKKLLRIQQRISKQKLRNEISKNDENRL